MNAVTTAISQQHWTYGAPPKGRYCRGEIVYGYQPWQRGQRLGYYEGRYQEVDYRSHDNLRPPPPWPSLGS